MNRSTTSTSHAPLVQLVGTSAAALTAYHGVIHELAGPLLFPWAPTTFGFVLWHGLGFLVIALGLLMWLGIAGLVRVPVLAISLFLALMGLGALVYIEVTHGVFHTFAMVISLASLLSGWCYRSLSVRNARR